MSGPYDFELTVSKDGKELAVLSGVTTGPLDKIIVEEKRAAGYWSAFPDMTVRLPGVALVSLQTEGE
ncbi:hypothetical protein [Amycolatopsis anabasis]|uniref:hypothetical protein n=1 Tax=Amycolatopsis anabasis TaxID=1840409 RepID=UPI00131A8962|nr:hypothetical protein [Amycolatopsis anabasis]